jgi:hypothetical protein
MSDETGTTPRWMGVGHSGNADAASAGAQAATAATAGRSPTALIVYCSTAYDLERLLDGVRSQAGDETVIVGCTTLGQVVDGRPDPTADGVVVAALGGPGLEVRTTLGRDVSARRREAGEEAAACVGELTKDNRVCLLLCDGLVGEQHEVVRGAYSVVGALVPLVGGCAGDDLTYSRTHQFFGDRSGVEILTDAVIGVGLGSDAKLGIGIAHGWRKVGEPMIVTKSNRNEVYTLDDRPAVEAYLRRLGAPPAAFADPAAFERFAESRPIGVRSRSGEVVRNVGSSARLAAGWLSSSGEVPEGGLIWPMEGDAGTVLQAADDACADATARLGGRTPLGLIAFDCETRARFLGADGRREEVTRMAAHAGPAPLAGLYTWGEIARTKGINGFHNQTLVVLAVG